MQRIEIISAEVQTKKGVSKKNGKPWEIRTQAAALHDSRRKYPQEMQWQLEDGQGAYAPGLYDVTDTLAVGDFGRLVLGREIVLTPARQAKAA